jgi:catechol 2,3-dioxygenase-like lactoylglutathione lyase family enzyme
MRIEHIAYNVSDPAKVAAWYVQHLGWTICRGEDKSPFAQFVADSSGQMMVEIYRNPAAPVPDYHAMHPLVLHIGLACGPDLEAQRQRLIAAGAVDAGGILVTPLGDRLAMLRDPWGMPIQLCNRKKEFRSAR